MNTDVQISQIAQHPAVLEALAASTALRRSYRAKTFLPALPLAAVALLICVRLLPRPRGIVTKAIALLSAVAYGNWYARLLKRARYDKAWMDQANKFLGEFVVPRLEERQREEQRVNQILSDHIENGSPFALYLRNFGFEAEMRVANVRGKGQAFTRLRIAPSTFEQNVVDKLADRVPILGISNSVAIQKGVSRIPKVEFQGEDWREMVRRLVLACDCIVLYVDRFTPGVLHEIEVIREEKAESKTIVVLGADSSQWQDVTYHAFTNQEAPPPPPTVQVGDKEIGSFPYFIQEKDIDFDQLFKRGPFSAVLRSMEFKSHLTSSEKQIEQEATNLTNLGNELAVAGRFDEAFNYFDQSLIQYQKINDTYKCLLVQESIAKCHYDMGSNQLAIEKYEMLLPLSRQQGDEFLVARLLIGLARSLYQQGDLDASFSNFNLVLPLLKETGRNEERRNALHGLGLIHKQRDELPDALECFCGALRLYPANFVSVNLCALAYSVGEVCFALEQFEKADLAFRITIDYCATAAQGEIAERARGQLAKISEKTNLR
jgi:tetratricopeptide (TPR) repeat protein